MKRLRVVLIKPSKYSIDGSVECFKTGLIPDATLYHIASLTHDRIGNVPVVVHTVDEYIRQEAEAEYPLRGDLQPVYGADKRWLEYLPNVVINPPEPTELARYWAPLLGLYPVRGCP